MSVYAEMDEDSEWAEVIGIDPGGTTGWSVMQVHPDALVEPDVSVLHNIEHHVHGQVHGDETAQAKDLLDLIMAWPDAVVVIEDFILRKYRKDRDLLSPVRITAMIEFGVRHWPGLGGRRNATRIVKQQPALAKTTVTDQRLKDWGLYVREGGEEHARDADRHVLTFLRRAKEKPGLRRWAWPSLYAEEADDGSR